jgi:HicB family
MSTLSVRLPTSLHRHLRDLAQREGVSMNQLISSAVGEKLAALMTEDYLSRANRGARKAFDAVLRRVPDVSPAKGDELSNNRMQLTRSAHRQRKRGPRN